MCGIVGAFQPSGGPLAPGLPMEAMLAALRHRGPDDLGQQRIGAYAHLGATRLSIVDVPGGHQPVASPGGGVWVTLNGEVYNHATLRRKEGARGALFENGSDTAVVATLLSRLPWRSALEMMQGMFALAAVDTRERRLLLVRDRMGVKPLYWTRLADGTLLWASELAALLQHPAVPRRIDPRALRAYLMFEYVPAPWSIYADIHKLEPGHALLADAQGGVRIERWWQPPVPEGGGGGSLSKWAQSVSRALRVAVHSRMEADVPVGYLLSGGLDSSSVVALARQRLPAPAPLHTFSVQVRAAGFDESAPARALAAALGTVHTEVPMDAARFLSAWEDIGTRLSEPLADSSLVPTWLLMRAVQAAGLKCVQSGDGADESFAGYPTYRAHPLAPLATPVRHALQQILRTLPVRDQGVTLDYMARQFVAGLGRPWAERHQVWMGAWLPEEVGATPEDWALVHAHARDAEASPTADAVARAMYLDQRLYLGEGVLAKVDRASMAHGVEVRSPFLDHRLVELAAAIPSALKLTPRQDKVVLRRAAAEWLPPDTAQRKKRGFGAPVGPWLRGPAQHLLRDLPDAVADLIDPDLVRRCLQEHQQHTADHRRRLWTLIVLARWRTGPFGPR